MNRQALIWIKSPATAMKAATAAAATAAVAIAATAAAANTSASYLNSLHWQLLLLLTEKPIFILKRCKLIPGAKLLARANFKAKL